MNKPTPGDWYVESDGHGPYVVAPNYGRVADVYDPATTSFKANGSHETWSNAHLISAAPNMLAALEKVNDAWNLAESDEKGRTPQSVTRLEEAMIDVRKALRKALRVKPGHLA